MSRSGPRWWRRPDWWAARSLAIAMAAVVVGLAAIAGIQSFTHIDGLALAYGSPPGDARLLPLSVDGLIVGAGIVLLWCGRRGIAPPWFCRWLLWAGIAATLAANVGAGVLATFERGPFAMAIGAVTFGWPAPAFVGVAELAFWLAGRRPPSSVSTAIERKPLPAPSSATEAAKDAFRKSLMAGNPFKPWALHTRFNISRGEAGQVIREVREEVGQL